MEYGAYHNNHKFCERNYFCERMHSAPYSTVHPDSWRRLRYQGNTRLLLKTKVHFVFTTAHLSSPVHQHIYCVFKTDCRQDKNICWNFQERKSIILFTGSLWKKNSLFRYTHHSKSPHTRLLLGGIAGKKASHDVDFMWESFNL